VGAFASYAWQGREVRSVHGEWRVPEIEEGSPCGIASTWIAAYGEGQAFIQIGTIEGCARPARDQLPLEAEYFTFWSDTSKRYHPHPLYQVQPGDPIEATLDIRHREWRLTIVDHGTGVKSRFATREETQRPPYIAEWAQEDPERHNSEARYPRLDEVKLSDVLVNGNPPNLEDLTRNTMSIGEELLAPTPLHDDSFAIQRQR
jgi:hypothetical protein